MNDSPKRGRPSKKVEQVVEAPEPKRNAMGRIIEEPAPPTIYTLTLTMGDKVYKSSGISPTEALGNLEKPAKIMSKGTLKITSGELYKELLMQPVRIKRLFYHSRGVQDVIAKQLFTVMK